MTPLTNNETITTLDLRLIVVRMDDSLLSHLMALISGVPNNRTGLVAIVARTVKSEEPIVTDRQVLTRHISWRIQH